MDKEDSRTVADKLLTAIQGCWKDSVFNFRKSDLLLADFPDSKEDQTIQFFLSKLENAAKECQSLEKMFRFAVICKIRTAPPKPCDSPPNSGDIILTMWGGANKGKTWDARAAPVALAGLTAYLAKTDVVRPLEPLKYLTENTVKKYGDPNKHKDADDTLASFLSSIPYLPNNRQIKENCKNALRYTLSGKKEPFCEPIWFLPAAVCEAKNLNHSLSSTYGTSAEFAFGILIE